jgi:transcriptional regulator with XRE-family HTH domain
VNERSSRISKLLTNTNSRASYVKAKLGVLVPAQIRALRLKSDMPRQSDLAREAGVHQSRISMFETPGAANVTLETLAKLAAAFKVGVVVKFVPFSDMLRWENDFSQDEFKVTKLTDDIAFLDPAAVQALVVAGDWCSRTAYVGGLDSETVAKSFDQPVSDEDIGDIEHGDLRDSIGTFQEQRGVA